jgi:hypothetical protein
MTIPFIGTPTMPGTLALSRLATPTPKAANPPILSNKAILATENDGLRLENAFFRDISI